eukprot:898150-Prorocentrum_minimum.AAC.9
MKRKSKDGSPGCSIGGGGRNAPATRRGWRRGRGRARPLACGRWWTSGLPPEWRTGPGRACRR